MQIFNDKQVNWDGIPEIEREGKRGKVGGE